MHISHSMKAPPDACPSGTAQGSGSQCNKTGFLVSGLAYTAGTALQVRQSTNNKVEEARRKLDLTVSEAETFIKVGYESICQACIKGHTARRKGQVWSVRGVRAPATALEEAHRQLKVTAASTAETLMKEQSCRGYCWLRRIA